MKKNEDAEAKKKPKTSAAQIRVQKGELDFRMSIFQRTRSCLLAKFAFIDITELDLPTTMNINFPDPSNQLNFELVITPDEGQQTKTSIKYHIVLAS